MSFSVSKILRKALSHVRHGEVKEAEILYKQILSEFPKNRQAILGYQRLKAGIDKKYLANSKPPDKQLQELLKLFNANRWEDVLQKVRPLIGLFPKSTSLRNLQGASYAALENYDAAIKSYDKAIEADPFFADAHLNKGSALQETGELDAAIVSFNHTLVINPQHSSAFFNLGNALMAKGELDLAIDGYKNALKLDPQNAEAYCYMGNAFKEKGQLDEALDCYGNALTIRPNYADVHLNMGTAYDKKGDIDAAISSFQQTLKINPKYAMAYFNMGKVHETQGELTAAINYYKQAVKEQPDFAMAISNLIYAINLNGQPEGHVRFSQLRAHVQGLEAPFASNHYCLNNSRDPERTLNIGFVSADFQEHPIATYCLQLFASLSKYPNLTLHAYYNNDVEDTITTEIKKYFYNWSAVKRISDHKLTEKIIEDEIDILIDLSNHTAGNRLSVFARKPVPLQVTALGLPYTTALKAMDYYFTNQIAPRDKAHFSECFLEIPSITAYAPLFDPPDVNDLPALKNGFITFGSCNKVSRISRSCIRIWSRLLRAIPNSRFVFAGQTNEFLQNRFKQWLIEENVDLSRIDFLYRKKSGDYFKIYHQMDVHLMLTPLAGTTTIADALFMGVPSLGLHKKNDEVGLKILSPLGLEDFVSKNEEDFISKGRSVAGKLAALEDIRTNLRKDFTASSYCNPDVAAASWETALRTIWKRWCLGLDPESKQLTMKDLKYSLSEVR